MAERGLLFYLAQMNPVLGDLSGNCQQILAHVEKAKKQGADIAVFPELCLTGYPPFDAFLHPEYSKCIAPHLKAIEAASDDIVLIIGHPAYEGKDCFNQASVFYQKACLLTYRKQHLPSYEIFNEERYFSPGKSDQSMCFDHRGHRLQVAICADAWEPEQYLVQNESADALIIINASPFHTHKVEQRNLMIHHCQKATGSAILYLNAVGGQDHYLFDGQSMCLDKSMDHPVVLCPHLQTDTALVDLQGGQWQWRGHHPIAGKIEQLYRALVLSIRDYVEKNGFKTILIGISGGIDSALSLALATSAIGADRVEAITLPSPYTSKETLEDAKKLCQNFNVNLLIEPIGLLYQNLQDQLTFSQDKTIDQSIVLQNMQARIRGLMLMSRANHTGALLLSCGNKSELALGYCTLYGDMVGGFAPLGDVLKTEVIALATWHNETTERCIPPSIIARPPTAELAPNQQDTDSLPPYEILDPMLIKILANPFDPEADPTVRRALEKNEFKRQQGATYCRVSQCSLRHDRRYPVTLHSDDA